MLSLATIFMWFASVMAMFVNLAVGKAVHYDDRVQDEEGCKHGNGYANSESSEEVSLGVPAGCTIL